MTIRKKKDDLKEAVTRPEDRNVWIERDFNARTGQEGLVVTVIKTEERKRTSKDKILKTNGRKMIEK